MRAAEYSDRTRTEARRQLSSLRIVNSETACSRYRYLARLIDDSDLIPIRDPRTRAAVRAAHREAYWKSLRLLRRDLDRMLLHRRRAMDATQDWRFEALMTESARIWRLLWLLRIAGLAHALHLPAMIAAAREASGELGRLLSKPADAEMAPIS